MRLNGGGKPHIGGMNGTDKSDGSAEPSMDEILTFLRGTLAEETERAAAKLPPSGIDVRQRGAPPAPAAAAVRSTGPTVAAKPQTVPAAAAPQPEAPAAAAAEPEPIPLKPVNMPFKDTRFARLSDAAPVKPEIVAEASVVPSPTAASTAPPPTAGGLSSLASARQSAKDAHAANGWPMPPSQGRASAQPHWTAAAMSSGAAGVAPQLANAAAAEPVVAAVLSPPPVPAAAPAIIDAEFNTVESAAADLLRPVLRQWLSDNMPRIVERALRIEMADTSQPAPLPQRNEK